jgi:hypothetical protein
MEGSWIERVLLKRIPLEEKIRRELLIILERKEEVKRV